MAGHSKWANIKRKKGANDEKRGKIFSKMSRLITVAAKEGGTNPDMNPALRLVIEKAKAERMPKENIERAIKKGGGVGGDSANYEEVVYEGYGPDGVAFLIKALTDNKNRTVAELRNIFNKYGGSMGNAGSAAYLFTPDPENPSYEIPVNDIDKAKKLMELVETFEDNDDVQEVFSNFTISDDISESL